MPPPDYAELDDNDKATLEQWIKQDVFCFDPSQPDPGKTTLRRLNRREYHNTIRDLLGIDFNTEQNFPPDDTGHGFDNLGDVLKVSPLHLEKYIKAARRIADEAVEKAARQPKDESLKLLVLPDEIPSDGDNLRAAIEDVLRPVASGAFRRPVDEETLRRLTDLVLVAMEQRGQDFNTAISEAIAAILASPRFLYRIEQIDSSANERFPQLDEYSLASRLSYFLWISMPDEELLQLAKAKRLRQELPSLIERMMADPKWDRFVKRFAGQWLGTLDVESKNINIQEVLRRDETPNPRIGELRKQLLALRQILPKDRTEEQKQKLRKNGEGVPTGNCQIPQSRCWTLLEVAFSDAARD